MKITPIDALLLIVLAACNATESTTPQVDPPLEKEPADSADYKHLRNTLYLHKSGQLVERKLAMARDTTAEFEVWYDSLMEVNAEDSTKFVPLSQVIDVDSYEEVDSTQFSRDKNQVYYFHPNSDGGVRLIVYGADPATFKRLYEYRWGIDKAQVYYKDSPLERVDIKTVQALYPPGTTEPFVEYIKDAYRVFYEASPVQGANTATFRLVKGKEWDAEDQYNRYKNGRKIWKENR